MQISFSWWKISSLPSEPSQSLKKQWIHTTSSTSLTQAQHVRDLCWVGPRHKRLDPYTSKLAWHYEHENVQTLAKIWWAYRFCDTSSLEGLCPHQTSHDLTFARLVVVVVVGMLVVTCCIMGIPVMWPGKFWCWLYLEFFISHSRFSPHWGSPDGDSVQDATVLVDAFEKSLCWLKCTCQISPLLALCSYSMCRFVIGRESQHQLTHQLLSYSIFHDSTVLWKSYH